MPRFLGPTVAGRSPLSATWVARRVLAGPIFLRDLSATLLYRQESARSDEVAPVTMGRHRLAGPGNPGRVRTLGYLCC